MARLLLGIFAGDPDLLLAYLYPQDYKFCLSNEKRLSGFQDNGTQGKGRMIGAMLESRLGDFANAGRFGIKTAFLPRIARLRHALYVRPTMFHPLRAPARGGPVMSSLLTGAHARRNFLKSAAAMLLSLLAACGIDGVDRARVTQPAAPAVRTSSGSTWASLPVEGAISPVHDPAVIRQGDTYYLFTTGHLADSNGVVPMRSSTDLQTWQIHGPVFPQLPNWASDTIPGTRGLWAPDISHTNGEFRLYYSVSTFGSNRSAIGLATNKGLNSAAPAAGWNDKGVVIQSHKGDDFNAIDPNAITDAQGRQWLAFGSFWSGIKMFELDPATGLRLAGDTALRSLARRPAPDAIEAPFVIRHGDYYYLFVSIDFCCRGAKSTYSTVVGRSREVTGPYLDRENQPMLEGGGTQVLGSGQGTSSRYVGRGHVAILQDKTGDSIVYHAYDTQHDGTPTLQIRPISWSADGWPSAE